MVEWLSCGQIIFLGKYQPGSINKDSLPHQMIQSALILSAVPRFHGLF